ncbi:hypothetical protein LB507_010737, partial [Fusarium sp. FIESC RH6]
SLYTDRQDYFAKSTTLLFEVAQLSNPFDPSGNATLLVSLVTSLPRQVKGKFISTRRRLIRMYRHKEIGGFTISTGLAQLSHFDATSRGLWLSDNTVRMLPVTR